MTANVSVPECMFTGAVYICTEDVFPNKRLQQLTESFCQYHTHTHPKLTAKYLSDNIYIEHVATIVSSSWAQAACIHLMGFTCQWAKGHYCTEGG